MIPYINCGRPHCPHHHYSSTQQQHKGLKTTRLEPLVSFLFFFFLYSTNFFYRTMHMYKDHNNHCHLGYHHHHSSTQRQCKRLEMRLHLEPLVSFFFPLYFSSTNIYLITTCTSMTTTFFSPPSPFFNTMPVFGHQPIFKA